jgi:class 3 adenylate cyclase
MALRGDWGVIMDVEAWLRSLGLERYEAAFRDNEIDGTVLPNLTPEDLKDLGVTIVGHRRKLLDAIAVLRADASAKSPPADAVPVTDRTTKDTAERRQVTVMFSDLVGSTALSARMDPEDLREVIAAYHKRTAEIVRRFDGFVSQYLGDGVLVYFGYPQAHEDDAERAVRAGLELIAAVGGLNTRASLQTRVGIATGVVVVGDLVDAGGSQERGIVGETPNLAARLQGIAEPNMVVIAESTRSLLGNLFELEDLGAREVKGIAGPIRAWAALRASSVESRFEALRSRRASLVGRDEEMELLLRRWNQAKTGDGRIVLISAEPGIGKSRLAEAVEENIAQEPHRRLRYFCSPHHQDSAFYPFIGHLEHAAGFARDDDTEARQRKLAQFVATIGVSNGDLPLLADLLSLAGTGSIPSPELTPQRKKEKTFDLLLRALETIARQQSLLMVFEDVHWIDPTSRELLDLTLARIERLPILLIATFRPEFQPPWIGQPHVTMMALPRLGRRDGAALVWQLAGAAELPADLLDEIIERTDGVPLFIEEVTNVILEAAEAAGGDTARSVASASLRTAVPATLQASLLARLDRLGPAAREMAQTGAAIGREFSYDIVSAVTERPAADVQAAFDRLVESGLVLQRGTPPAADYQFKHALVQDTSYGTLLRGPRQVLHGRIAVAMESRTPERAEREPEILAYHWTEAGNARRAVGYWLDAGRRAAARSANHEAVAHLSRGTEMVASLPEGAEAMRLELALQLTLGPAVMSLRGFGAREAQIAYRRARELAETLGDSRSLFTAIWGLWLTTGQSPLEIDRRAILVDELFRVAGPLGDTALELQAHHAAWATLIFRGDLISSREHIRRGLELYDRKLHGDHAVLYGGHDPAVCGAGHGAMALWMLGYPDQAVESGQRSIVLANDVAHQPSVGHALWFTGVVYMMRRDVSAVLRLAEQLVDVSRERGLAQYQAIGGIMRGWARARSGAIEDGLAELRAAIDAHRATARVLVGFFAAELAETELLGGHIEEAASALAIAVGTQAQERVWDSDISAVTGDLRLAQDPADLQAVEQMYSEAISIARDQNAKSLELRAALRLARLRQRQGQVQAAVHLIQPIYSWFTEGLDAADLKEARELLKRPA